MYTSRAVLADGPLLELMDGRVLRAARRDERQQLGGGHADRRLGKRGRARGRLKPRLAGDGRVGERFVRVEDGEAVGKRRVDTLAGTHGERHRMQHLGLCVPRLDDVLHHEARLAVQSAARLRGGVDGA